MCLSVICTPKKTSLKILKRGKREEFRTMQIDSNFVLDGLSFIPKSEIENQTSFEDTFKSMIYFDKTKPESKPN